MPLGKRSSAPVVDVPAEVGVVTTSIEQPANAPANIPKPKPAMTKDDYWRAREERDIETGKRIRRSGVWQAALQSTGLLQLNTENTFEAFMALVAKAANEGLKFVEKD